ncbi:hypothetical protein SLEP1_g33100 [Rubroshorea leprosula]|uniref:Uncharacterized protein n=1 Tax=Rubroshorea leprosula TaxID=152421 RepID=A0AAV5KFK2_9ROSI|nr:hypothetical protein SLEP1_g33100 [Rubroshorea leprosula]
MCSALHLLPLGSLHFFFLCFKKNPTDTLSGDGLAYIGNKFLCGAPDAVITCDSNSSSGDPETINLKDSAQQQVFYEAVIPGYGVGTTGFFLILQLMNETWRQRYWTAIDRIALRIIRCCKMVQ